MRQAELPLVKSDTCFSIQQIFERDDSETYVFEYLNEIKRSNPIVGLWIERFSKKTRDPAMSAACAAVVYKMLESQLEADALNSMYSA